jgi:tetratricopeptide (TPR) repeat protein
MTRFQQVLSAIVVLRVSVLLVACGPARPAMLPVVMPDMSRTDPAVQKQVKDSYDELGQLIDNRSTSLPDLASAYGHLGMLLQAAQFFDIAEAGYRNAQALAPGEHRWPYYLGHLYKSQGQTDKADDAFARALALQPDDVPTLIWLGRLYLDQGRGEAAAPLFSKALERSPQSVAALAGLGRVALATRSYEEAVRRFEAALAINPQSESLHAPLAAAYRGLGQADKAQPHLRLWRNTDILLPDPLQEELDLILESGLSYELRGVRALDSKDYVTAANFFRRGLELAPADSPLRRSLRHKLGTALFAVGQVDHARRAFLSVADSAPADGIDESTAKAHYSLGILAAERAQDDAALKHLAAAIRYQPSYMEAHLGLADALRRRGRLHEALAEYDEAIAINPRDMAGRLGHAIVLAGLQRDREAREWLEESIARFPDRPQFRHALARVLVTASDPHVRDSQRATVIVRELFERDKSMSVGETMAMTLAEAGDYEQAAQIQRGVLSAAIRATGGAMVPRLESNLRLYEQRRPCRTPWRNDEPVFLPTPMI